MIYSKTIIFMFNFNLDTTVGNTRRTNFMIGTKFKPSISAIRSSLPNPLSSLRDSRFSRPAFSKSSPIPRGLKSIEEIEKMKIKQEGIKVRLGDATLGKIKVKKRNKAGEVILDEQGQPVMEEVTLNFALLAQMLEGSFGENMDKLEELATAIRTGATNSSADRAAFTVSLAKIMSDAANISQINQSQLDFIIRSLQLLGISRDPVQAGIQDLVQGRFVTSTTWNAASGRNKGPIILFLIANVRDKPDLSPNKPIFGKPDRHSGHVRPIQLITIFTLMNGSSRKDPAVLDLIDKTTHNTLQEAINRASETPTFPQFGVPPPTRQRITPGVSLEEEDATGAFQLLGAIPGNIFQRLEGENMMERLMRESQEEKTGALIPVQQLGPYFPGAHHALQPLGQPLPQVAPVFPNVGSVDPSTGGIVGQDGTIMKGSNLVGITNWGQQAIDKKNREDKIKRRRREKERLQADLERRANAAGITTVEQYRRDQADIEAERTS